MVITQSNKQIKMGHTLKKEKDQLFFPIMQQEDGLTLISKTEPW